MKTNQQEKQFIRKKSKQRLAFLSLGRVLNEIANEIVMDKQESNETVLKEEQHNGEC